MIESLHMQHCILRGCIRPPPHLGLLRRYLILKITRMGTMIPKEIKYNLHYNDVLGDLLRPQHRTTPATVE